MFCSLRHKKGSLSHREPLTLDFVPNEGTGFRNSLIWQKLYHFQRDGAIGIIQKLEKYNGCILADGVGLGKTFTALAVMKYYASRNKNILVLTPKKLANNWNKYLHLKNLVLDTQRVQRKAFALRYILF